MDKKKTKKYKIKIKSKIHPDIYHTAYIDLHCYEKMTKEKETNRKVKINLYCYKKLTKKNNNN